MAIRDLIESLKDRLASKKLKELEEDNVNFVRRCDEQAKAVFYEKSTHISEAILHSPVPSLYHIEINSQCNLKCRLCGAGNLASFQTKNGIMKLGYFQKIIEKIHTENEQATILPFGNSEPFLNRNICEYVRIIKENKLKCTLSSNLNVFSNVEQTLELEPETLIVSISGYTQPVYAVAHRGGDIETVKANMKKLSQLRDRNHLKTTVILNYHLYTYNWGKDFDEAKRLAQDLGFVFAPNCARSISMEMTLQYMSQLEKARLGHEPTKLPFEVPLPQTFYEGIETLIVKPDDAFAMYKDVPPALVCPFTHFETYIRADGSVQLCGCCSDARLTLVPDYLKTSHEALQRKRRWHPLCEVCLRTRTYLYFNMVDLQAWDNAVKARIPQIPSDRLMLGA